MSEVNPPLAGQPPAQNLAYQAQQQAQVWRQTIQERWQTQPRVYGAYAAVAVIVAVGRVLFDLGSWLDKGMTAVLFVAGATIAPLLFWFESQWLPLLQKQLRLAPTPTSPLRQSLIIFLLPIVGLFLLSSSRTPLGLGFLWGISAWYAWEVSQLLQGHRPLIYEYYRTDSLLPVHRHQALLVGYLLYGILLTVGLWFV